MKSGQNRLLSHVIWIGGATDSGKTTVSQLIARRHHLHLYNYDHYSSAYLEKKSESSALFRDFLDASLDERWIYPTPEELLQFALQSFESSLPFVIEDLLNFSPAKMVVAEGFAFTPELIHPYLSDKHQAVWLVPTDTFKWDSMKRRGKPSFSQKTSDPQKATQNLFKRDMLLAQLVKEQAAEKDLQVIEIDGSQSAAEVAAFVDQHFQKYSQNQEQ